ncbi:MAG: hypothetical protein CMH82_14960 [Nocardioides sp.]|nr:hypothetical protein [Nocardioides sp.]|tara:strand:- start:748 stop:1131 length:384 start_codon:yes stop_codon:yes gene_type:complete
MQRLSSATEHAIAVNVDTFEVVTDDTLRTMVALFPIMLLIAAVEARAVRDREIYSGGILPITLVGTIAAGTGVILSILELWARENDWGWGDASPMLWWLAVASASTAVVICVSLLAEWLRGPTADED